MEKTVIEKNRGLIQVYTGNGKGKTTAAFGSALRAAGQGLRVLIIQFMKKRTDVGEIMGLAKTDLPVTVKQFGRRAFFKTRTCESMDIHMAHLGLTAFIEAMSSHTYDLIILDEINMAIFFGMLEVDELLKPLKEKPRELHVILTGRSAAMDVIDIADLVTEMTEIKHPYSLGVNAQKGIEY